MSDFFNSVEAYIAALKVKAADAALHGAAALEELAAWVRAHSGGQMQAAQPPDPARLATCKTELAALAAQPKPKGAAQPVGCDLTAILAAILAAL